MPLKVTPPTGPVYFEEHPDPKVQDRCPGNRTVYREGRPYVVLCDDTHDHQEVIKVGPGGRESVPAALRVAMTEDELDEKIAVKEEALRASGREPRAQAAYYKKVLQYIREKNHIESLPTDKEIAAAKRNQSPDVATIPLPESLRTDLTACPCGRPIWPADWRHLGVEEGPKVCDGCSEMPGRCTCKALRPVWLPSKGPRF